MDGKSVGGDQTSTPSLPSNRLVRRGIRIPEMNPLFLGPSPILDNQGNCLMPSGKFAKDITGMRFGSWTVKARAGKRVYYSEDRPYSTQALWLCVCDCGTEKVLTGFNLRRSGGCVSCRKRDYHGRFEKRMTEHGRV